MAKKEETRNFNIVFAARDVTAAAFKSVGAGVKRLTGELFEMRTLLAGALGSAGIGLGIREMVNAAGQAELAGAKLGAVLKATGNAAGFSKDELSDFASSLQGISTFDDDAIVDAQAVLATFTNVAGKNFKDATRAALDMSRVLGQDLQSSVTMIGKALQDPVKGVTALGKAGVNFSAQQKYVIADLAETGRLAEAQQVILAELRKEYGGAAEAAGSTFAGEIQKLNNDIGNLKEAIGGLIGGPSGENAKAFSAWVREITGGVQALARDWQNQIDLSVNEMLLRMYVFRDGVTSVFHYLVDTAKWAGAEMVRVLGQAFEDAKVNAKGVIDFIRSGGKEYKFQSQTMAGFAAGGAAMPDFMLNLSPQTLATEKAIDALKDAITEGTRDAIRGGNGGGEGINRDGPPTQMTGRMWEELGTLLSRQFGDSLKNGPWGWIFGAGGTPEQKARRSSQVSLPQFQDAGSTTGLAAAARERQMNSPLLEEARRQRKEQEKTNGYLDDLPKKINDAFLNSVGRLFGVRSATP